MDHSHLIDLSSVCDVFQTRFDKEFSNDAACKENFPHEESLTALFKKLNDSTKKQFGTKGVCQDLVICNVKNPEIVSDHWLKLTLFGLEFTFDGEFQSGLVFFINLLFGIMVAHLIKKGFEIFTDCPIESFEAESEDEEDEILDANIQIDTSPEGLICNGKQEPTEAESISK